GCIGSRSSADGLWYAHCPSVARRAGSRSTREFWLGHTSLRVGNTRRRKHMELINRLRAFVRNEEGQDLIEYALLVALISLVAVAAVTAAGGSVNTIFTNIAARLASAA